MPADPCGSVRGARRLFTKLLGQLRHVLAMYVRQHASQPTSRRVGRPIPEAGGQGGLCCGSRREDTPCPQHVFRPEGHPATGQRSRDIACACAPLRCRGVVSTKGAATPEGPSMARDETRRLPGALYQVARRSGGIAAIVRPLEGRGRGRTRVLLVGRRPLPQ